LLLPLSRAGKTKSSKTIDDDRPHRSPRMHFILVFGWKIQEAFFGTNRHPSKIIRSPHSCHWIIDDTAESSEILGIESGKQSLFVLKYSVLLDSIVYQ